MLNHVFLPHELLRLVALLLLNRRHLHNGSQFLSLDMLVYQAVQTGTTGIANFLYGFLPAVKSDYADRYPLFPIIQQLYWPCLTSFVQFCICCVTLRRSLVASSRQNSISLLCGAVLISCQVVVALTLYLYHTGRATINLLDVADVMHNVGSVALGAELIPQVSVNWFYDTSRLERRFQIHATLSLLSAGAAYVYLRLSGIPWYEHPYCAPSRIAVLCGSVALGVLWVQSYMYRQTPASYIPL